MAATSQRAPSCCTILDYFLGAPRDETVTLPVDGRARSAGVGAAARRARAGPGKREERTWGDDTPRRRVRAAKASDDSRASLLLEASRECSAGASDETRDPQACDGAGGGLQF